MTLVGESFNFSTEWLPLVAQAAWLYISVGRSTLVAMSVDLGEMIDELRRLNALVPRPQRLPTKSEVLQAEELLGLAFHEDFRRFLLEASDVVYGQVEPVTISGGHTELGAVFRDARESGVPNGLIPVCEDNGDYHCIASTGEVVFWSHNGTTDESWPSLAAWIQQVWIGGN